MPPLTRSGPFSRKQQGFIAYVLSVCVLLAAVSVLTIRMARTNTSSKFIFEATNTVYAAGALIQTKIRYCPVAFPRGHNHSAFAVQYPLGPTAVAVDTISCPPQVPSEVALTPADVTETLFTGGDGLFLPVMPKGFGVWQYVNDASGVRIFLQSDGSAARNKVLANVAEKFPPLSVTLAGNVLTLWIKK